MSRSRRRPLMRRRPIVLGALLSSVVSLCVVVLATPTPAGALTTLAIPNFNFETADANGGPADWDVSFVGPKPATGQIASVSNEHVYKNLKSLRVAKGTGNDIHADVQIRSAKLPTLANYQHTARIQVATSLDPAWNPGSYGREVPAYSLEFWDSTKTKRIGMSVFQPVVSSAWTRAQVVAVSPPGTAYVSVLIEAALETGGLTYWDEAALYRADSPEVVPAPSSNIASDKQLVLDDGLIDSSTGLTRTVHQATKSSANPVLVGSQPWEHNYVYPWGSVIYDASATNPNERFKMWYEIYSSTAQYLVAYATSADGITWLKPDLGVFTDNTGSTHNNIVMEGTVMSVSRDDADPDPNRRYKATTHQYGTPDHTKAYATRAFTSPDGIHWTAINGGQPILPGGDNINTFWDPAKSRWVSTWKPRRVLDPGSGNEKTARRLVNLAYSTDFSTWTQQGTIFYPDAQDDALAATQFPGGASPYLDFQLLATTRYAGYYVGLPLIDTHVVPPNHGKPGSKPFPQFAFSRDMVHWTRDRVPSIPLGPACSSDSNYMFVGNEPVVVGNEIWWYYGASGWVSEPDAPTTGECPGKRVRITGNLAKWRLDGFVSRQNSGSGEGVLTTKPVTFTGNTLRVNAKLNSGGAIRAELLDASGNVIPGFDRAHSVAFSGDDVAQAMSWSGKTKADLAALAGTQVKVRFYLDEGDLYAYQFVTA